MAVVRVHAYRHSCNHCRDASDDACLGHVRVHDMRPQVSQRAHQSNQRTNLADHTKRATQSTDGDDFGIHASACKVVAFARDWCPAHDGLFNTGFTEAIEQVNEHH